MTQPIISVENLSKGYRIGAKEEAADTIVGALTKSIRAPLRNLRRLHEATSIRDGDERDDILWALKDVSFEVHEGEVVGVIGRNGAGKSTLLKILSRITEPTGGRAVIRGRVSSLLEVGTGFHPELTGRENIYMNGTILGMTKREIDRKFDEIIDFSGVEKFLDTPTKRYSSGMQVRLAFAVAAHLEPEILIIDEVLAVGDAEFQKKCLGKMKDVADGGRTVLFVSHNFSAVEALCSRCVLLTNGRFAFSGATGDVIDEYRTSLNHHHSYSAAVPLSEHPNRRSGSKSLLLELQVVNSSGDQSTEFTSDEPVTFEVTCRPAMGSGRLCFAVFVLFRGTRVLMLHSKIHSGLTTAPDATVKLSCRVESLPLTVGSYDIEVAVGRDSGELLDYVENATTLTIIDSDVLGTGALPTQQQSVFIQRAEWDVTVVEHASVHREVAV